MKLGQILKLKPVICRLCGKTHQAKQVGAACSQCKRIKSGKKTARRRAANPDKHKAYMEKWRLNNPEKRRQHKRKFQELNRAHRTAYQNARYANKLRRTPSWANLDYIKGMYELCAVFRRIGLDLEVDHIIPLQGEIVSGLHVENNLRLIHSRANMAKKNRFFEELLT